MAKKLQCEQCDAFIKERELCRKKWKVVEFDEVDCPSYIDENGSLRSAKDDNLKNESTDDGKSAYEDTIIKVGLLLTKGNKSRLDVEKILVADGLSTNEAQYVVDSVVSHIRQKCIEDSVMGFFKGCLCLIVGLAVTVITYVWASIRGGGMYIFTYGAIAFGVIIMIIAIVNFIRAILYKW